MSIIARALIPVPLVCALASALLADESTPSADDIKFFESHVRPVLVENCFRCHGEKSQKGKLRLDSRTALLAGGESGPCITPGKPDESLLVEAINYASVEMPPDGKLKPEEIAALTEWVRRGAPWTATVGSNDSGVRKIGRITDEDRSFWSFRPLQRVSPPRMQDDDWCRTEIDRFVFQKIREANLRPGPEADRRTLIRRAYFDLVGIPPLPAEIDQFVADPSANAYERMIDRLLDNPGYGERWARHWLDLVRYAESDGFKQDAYRAEAWRYRDYVIGSFNEDKPYDQFVLEQLAGDEVAPGDLKVLPATSYLRHWIYEYNQRDVRTQWHNILNDVTDVTAEVFLGVSLGCARCHDHKFDPISQRDYFRFQAFFAPLLPRDDLLLAPESMVAEYRERFAAWEGQTADLRRELDELERPIRQSVADAAINKFPPDIRPLLRKAASERTVYEHQLAELGYRQITEELNKLDFAKKLSGDAKQRWEILKKELAAFDKLKPAPLPAAFTVTDVGVAAAATHIPGDPMQEDISPGVLSIFDPAPLAIATPAEGQNSTGRRSSVARWIVRPDNPLTARVIVNRVWQYHFGQGIVGTASDFGQLGDRPTHPELLDWLAEDFVANGWKFKRLHRLIMTSSVYRQASSGPIKESGVSSDPENQWLSRVIPRRLQAEQIRDAMLSASGELDLRRGGPSDEFAGSRRTIYTKVLRNVREPLLEVFDGPDGFNSTAKRDTTTTPTQSLLMINGPWTHARAIAVVKRLQAESEDPTRWVAGAYRLILGREPDSAEMERASQFLHVQADQTSDVDADLTANDAAEFATRAALIDFCHVLFNSNEFLYVD